MEGEDGAVINSEILFEVKSKLGIKVRTTVLYWEKITTQKHPRMAGLEQEVKETLQDPEQIRKSRSDLFVYL
jgi:hypothetical protein